MKPIKIKVRDAKFRGVYEVVVNGEVLCERPHARYANDKAKAFRDYLVYQGMIVDLTLCNKAA